MNNIEEILEKNGVRPTSNRILVLRALLASSSPQSLMDLDTVLETLDKSSISRSLAVLMEHGVIHAVEDGRGITRYESCHGHHSAEEDLHGDSDMHVHFYCEKCMKVFCFEDIPAPAVKIPEGFRTTSVNYMVKGICPSCRSHK